MSLQCLAKTDRCLNRSPKRDIAILFSVLFVCFVVLYAVNSSAKKFFFKHPCLRSVLLLFEYSTGSVLIFTFIPFTIYDFFCEDSSLDTGYGWNPCSDCMGYNSFPAEKDLLCPDSLCVFFCHILEGV